MTSDAADAADATEPLEPLAANGEEAVLVHKSTVGVRLGCIVRDRAPVTALRAMARLMHCIRRDAYELIAHHVFRMLEADKPIPDIHDQSVVYRFFVAVVDCPGEQSKYGALDAEIAVTRAQAMSGFVRHTPLLGCVPAMELERAKYLTHLQAQVARSFRKRVGRIVQLRLRLSDAELAALTKAQKKERGYWTKIAMASATRPSGSNGLPSEFATVVDAVVADLGLASIDLKVGTQLKPIAYVLKAKPTRFLPALQRINAELGRAGERQFRLTPLVTSNVPGFFTIDQKVLRVMGLVSADAKKKINARAKKRRADARPYTARRDAIRAEIRRLEAEWKQEDFATTQERYPAFATRWIVDDMIRQVEEQAREEAAASAAIAAAAAQPSSARKRKAPSTKRATAPARKKQRRSMPKTATLTPEQVQADTERAEARAAILAPLKAALAAIDEDPVYLKLVDDQANERRDVFEAVFEVTDAVVSHPERWCHSLSTDGLSARLMFKKKTTTTTAGSSKAPELTAMPKRGIIPFDELVGVLTNRHGQVKDKENIQALGSLPPIELNRELNTLMTHAFGGTCPYVVVGCDPGKRELLAVSNPDVVAANHAERKANPLPKSEAERAQRLQDQQCIRYTSAARRMDTTPGVYTLNKKGRQDEERQEIARAAQRWRQSMRTPALVEAEAAIAAMSRFNSAGATGAVFKAYTDAKRAVQPVLDRAYADDRLMHRKLRWKAFIDKQKSLQDFVDRLKAVERATGKQLVLAYGQWGLVAGRPGSPGNKGNRPGLGIGLAKHLSRFFVVVFTPEQYTSKTCFHCGCHDCGNHAGIAEQHRRTARDAAARKRLDAKLAFLEQSGADEAAKTKAQTIYTRTVAKTPEIRGLRFCPGCARCLNRDRNAACNIGLQFKRLLFGLGPIKALSKEEKEMVDADADMD